ncbi:TonB-dependent receptor [Aquincola sp. S2]|uniref:TonB-dependent receptor n=1 Tax=Pseudaquabacterium terrae TaxID=2732868 RepID=A0ABX2ES99_9BURK|nr:TonB-dependent receptor [Aquabacterium terrae]NRF71570.1 TonB-dependent receptor [Aquabacterium terrae]
MKSTLTPIAAAALLCALGTAQAQTAAAAPAAKASEPASTVIVTGIRASREQSLNQKRNADGIVDVITAEDLGKLPDKNVADAVQRIPGVNISSMAGGEGGFSENDRVSIRGTSPSLTQTLINGHAVGTGDWFVLSQTEAMGRSVSYALLPSEIVSKVTVFKSSQADLPEGGTAGSIDIETRRPLSFTKPFTAEATVQGFYADLPRKSAPQISALFNWKNQNSTFGATFQVFSETRYERRDAQEFLGYGHIEARLPLTDEHGEQMHDEHGEPLTRPNPVVEAHPQLAGVQYPLLINHNLFTQKRVRKGGLFDIEWKPTNALTLDVNGFFSHMDATNYDHSYLASVENLLASEDIPSNPVVRNGTLVAAQFPNAHGTQVGFTDSMYRPGAASESWYLDVNGKYRASDHLTITGKAGHTRGLGDTPGDLGYESYLSSHAGLNFAMNGMSSPTIVSFPGMNTADFHESSLFGMWYSIVRVVDKESYAQADAEWAIDKGVLDSAKFGVRFTDHKRQVRYPNNGGCGWGAETVETGACPGNAQWDGTMYPANFGRGFGGGDAFLRNLWRLPPHTVEQAVKTNTVPTENYWPGEFAVGEKTAAAYAMLNLAGDKWRGNVGLRFVRTKQATDFNIPEGPNPVESPTFGPFTRIHDERSYDDVLPSANLRLELGKDLVARFSAAKTMTRVDYSALAGAITSLDNLTHSGHGGNVDLKPVRSRNLDASIEWYFAPKAVLSAALFHMDFSSYLAFGTRKAMLPDASNQNAITEYTITSPINIRAKNKGVELGYQQPLFGNFGIVANYTYTSGKDSKGDGLVGSSKDTWNLEGYYEDDRFSARLAYTYRSAYLVGLDRSTTQYADAVGYLAASLNYKINDNVTIAFDALNLNNPTLKYFGDNRDQPRAFYTNGRQYFLGVRVSI